LLAVPWTPLVGTQAIQESEQVEKLPGDIGRTFERLL
jgi:hypothetical protein